MSNQNSFFDQFKAAAKETEQQRFPGFDDVWQQVETRLDEVPSPKVVTPFYKTWMAVAASLLLLVLLGLGIYKFSGKQAAPMASKGVQQLFPAELQDSTIADQPIAPNNALTSTEKESEINSIHTAASGVTTDGQNSGVHTSVPATHATTAVYVSGVVTDTSGLPIAGASIVLDGKNKMVVADAAGAFTLKANAGDLLAVQAVGYDAARFKVAENMQMKIALEPANNALQEVVVVGYSANRKSELVAAVPQSNNQQLMASNTTGDLQQQLQGRVAGLAMADARSKKAEDANKRMAYSQGAPGANTNIQIRGSATMKAGSEPLYIVNGTVANGNVLKIIDPKNIEKVDVLKDGAATSIYGSIAQNGVVIITTKALSKKEQNDLRKFNDQLLKSGLKIDPIPQAIFNEPYTEEYNPMVENPFTSPQVSPLSTFSIDVDNASYTNIRRYINNGQVVPQDAVRVEEMINFFKYRYAAPTGNQPFAAQAEYSDAPWNKAHKLLRIALKAKEIPAEQLPPSNIVFLIDVSGSMSEANKLPLLKSSMKVLVDQLRQQDKLSIVVYAGAAGLVLPPTNGDEKQTILDALNKLSAGGSTAGGAGIELAYKTAAENFVKDGNNRVVLATDGDFNVGISAQGDLQRMIEEKRKSGIFLTCLGFGMGNYKDNRLETLADKGNGNYAYIDNMQESNRFLGKEFKGTLFAVAKDVKLQIEFNPAQVKAYRLIGYENRKLNDEDFVNDKIDAGEMGVGHTVTALYEIIPVGVNSTFSPSVPALKYTKMQPANSQTNELATLKFRYKKPDADSSTEMVIAIGNRATPLQNASEDFRFVAAVAWFGLKLRQSDLIANKDIGDIIKLAGNALSYDPDGYRAECVRLMQIAKWQ